MNAVKQSPPATRLSKKNGKAQNGVFLAAVHQAKIDITIPIIPPHIAIYSAIALPSTDNTPLYLPAVNFFSRELKETKARTSNAVDKRKSMIEMNLRQIGRAHV